MGLWQICFLFRGLRSFYFVWRLSAFLPPMISWSMKMWRMPKNEISKTNCLKYHRQLNGSLFDHTWLPQCSKNRAIENKQSILKLICKMYHNYLPSCMTAHIAKLQSSYNLGWQSHPSNRIPKSIPYLKEVQSCGIISQLSVVTRRNSVKSLSRMINKLTLFRDIDFSNLFRRR